jgi:hypothetical protein
VTNAHLFQYLAKLRTKLAEADAFADVVRNHALRDYSSDEPYENAAALSGRIAAAIAILETMLEDIEIATIRAEAA